MADTGEPPHRRRAAIAIALAVLVVIGWWLWPRGETPKTSAAPVASTQGGTKIVYGPLESPVPAAPTIAVVAPPKVTAPSPEDLLPPIIDEISVEKREVCSGEENLITIRAHTPNGTDPFLHYLVGTDSGIAVPLRLYLQGDKQPPKQTITVFGKNNVATRVEVPEFLVKDCKPARTLNVVPSLRANTWGEYEVAALIVEMPTTQPSKPFVAKSFLWSFGDGTTETTTAPTTSHSYEGRPQTSMYSTFLITVEATGDDGTKVTGRHAMELINPAYESLATKGLVTLMIKLDPRFPAISSDGLVRQGVRLFHTQAAPITVTKVTRLRSFVGGGESQHEEVAASAVLGSSTIPPGAGLTTTVMLDTVTDAEIFAINYLVEGVSAEGYPARGSFSVMRPPRAPTKGDHDHMIPDPVLTAKIVEARRLLGRDTVTDDDLMKLEREGKFANLQVPPGPMGTLDQGSPEGTKPHPPSPPSTVSANPGAPPVGPTAQPGSSSNPNQPPPPKPPATTFEPKK